MREIKFRAWVKPGELTNHVNGVIADAKPNFYESDCLIERLDLTGKKNFREIFDFDRIELMQYTGLKDKNGVDIYEGDIYRVPYGGMFKIYYDAETASFLLDSLDGNHTRKRFVADSPYPDGEIIGNIYENPELMEASK